VGVAASKKLFSSKFELLEGLFAHRMCLEKSERRDCQKNEQSSKKIGEHSHRKNEQAAKNRRYI
jgi:hypothetical protein